MRYRVEFDLVHEMVAWFSEKGGATAGAEVAVGPASSAISDSAPEGRKGTSR